MKTAESENNYCFYMLYVFATYIPVQSVKVCFTSILLYLYRLLLCKQSTACFTKTSFQKTQLD